MRKCLKCGKERGNGRKYCRDCKYQIRQGWMKPVYKVEPVWVYVVWYESGDMYIGQTNEIHKRHRQHIYDGLEGEMCVIEEFPSEDLARKYESELIEAHPVTNARRSI